MSDTLLDPEPDEAAKTEHRRRDPGLLAIQQIAWELEQLDDETRKFAILWLTTKYPMEGK